MRLTMRERQAVTKVLRMRYRRASKKEKGQLLDELVRLTGLPATTAAALRRAALIPRFESLQTIEVY
jgi:hypothetical protein